MNTTVAQCRHSLALAERLLCDLTDAHLALEPRPGAKTAGWLVGHLAITGDFARRLCGAQPLCPREWRPAFAPGSRPSTDPGGYPPIQRLCVAFRGVYSDLCVVAPAADPALLSVPNPFEAARGDFPSAGDFVEYLMAGHLAYHLGQLSGWRAAVGLSALGAADT